MSKLKDEVDKISKPHSGYEGGLAWAKREYEILVEKHKNYPVSCIKRMREIWWNAYKAGQASVQSESLTYKQGKSDAITEMQILINKMSRDNGSTSE